MSDVATGRVVVIADGPGSYFPVENKACCSVISGVSCLLSVLPLTTGGKRKEGRESSN